MATTHTRIPCVTHIHPPAGSVILLDVDDTLITTRLPDDPDQPWDHHSAKPLNPAIKPWLHTHLAQSRVVFLSARTCDPQITREQMTRLFDVHWPHVEHWSDKHRYAGLMPRTGAPIYFFDDNPHHINAMVQHCPWVHSFLIA